MRLRLVIASVHPRATHRGAVPIAIAIAMAMATAVAAAAIMVRDDGVAHARFAAAARVCVCAGVGIRGHRAVAPLEGDRVLAADKDLVHKDLPAAKGAQEGEAHVGRLARVKGPAKRVELSPAARAGRHVLRVAPVEAVSGALHAHGRWVGGQRLPAVPSHRADKERPLGQRIGVRVRERAALPTRGRAVCSPGRARRVVKKQHQVLRRGAL